MPEAAYSSIMTEAVAVFHDVKPFQAAIDHLLSAGFDHADIAVLAHEGHGDVETRLHLPINRRFRGRSRGAAYRLHP